MKNHKRLFALFLSLLVCLTVLPAPCALAAETDAYGGIELSPMMEYIMDTDSDFQIKSGTASVYGYVRGRASTTKSQVKIELQEKSGSDWTTIETWCDTQSKTSAEVDDSKSVTAGKSYRTVTTFTVWCGTKPESQTLTSKTLTA